jgi:predicted ATPase/polyhydroxyalkanoate synthesis regulator phasin
MELVYLWVENYKNIQKQGFNFSPRFRCEYDEESKELEIIDKEKTGEFYPKDFFGENINVTAIVGENGSGKSSLLTGITNGKILIKKDKKYFTNDFISEKYEFNKINREEDYSIVYIDYDLIKINPVRNAWDYDCLNIYDKNLYKKTENASGWDSNFNIASFRRNFFNMIVENKKDFISDTFFFNPIKISISDYIAQINPEKNEVQHINKLIKEVEQSNPTKEKFLVFLYSNISMKVPSDVKIVDTIDDLLSIEKEILTSSKYLKLIEIKKIYDFINELKEKKMSIDDFSKIYKNHKEAFLNLIKIGYLNIDLIDSIGREYFDLSSGERKLFTEMLMIFDAIKNSEENDVLVVLDEPDLALHPDWQKKYISEMIKLLSNFPKKKFHLIVTSHSPFILSDLPKENIIFLEKGKQVYPFENGQTFGANIHTLLSHGFFMNGGLMGEFAKGKIDDVINYLNNKKSEIKNDEDAQNIINIIGEPIIKRELQKMLDSKRLSKVDKIDKIEKDIEQLQKELKELRNANK